MATRSGFARGPFVAHLAKPLSKINVNVSSKKRTNGEAGSASSPPLKRQKIVAASSSSSVSNEEWAAQNLQLKQRLQSAEEEIARLTDEQAAVVTPLQEEIARLHEELTEQAAVVQPLQEAVQRLHALNGSIRESFRRYGPSWNGKTTDIDIIDNLSRLSNLATHYNANVTNQFIRDIPEMLWWQKILQPFLTLEDLSFLRRTNTFFQSYWECLATERDTSATGVPHRGESDGGGGGLLGTKSVHE